MEEIREVLHFENSIDHKILITYVIAKVSGEHNHADDNSGKRSMCLAIMAYAVCRKKVLMRNPLNVLVGI